MSGNSLNFIHLYAVDIGDKTFPMEVFWRGKYGDESWIIDPNNINELKGRHEKYMEAHQFSYNDLNSLGNSPQTLCICLNESFAAGEVYVADEELDWNRFLLNELYNVSQIQPANYILKPLYPFLFEKAQNQKVWEELKKKIKELDEPFKIVGGPSKFFWLRDLVKIVFEE